MCWKFTEDTYVGEIDIFLWPSCSGDIDGVVPTTGTRYWLRQLDLTVEVPWYPWNHSTQV